MRHLDMDTLAAFVAVFDHGGFTAAAEQIGKTQAAVSIMLSRLEKHLGQRLMERSRQGIKLTPAGEKLIGYARQMQTLEEEALSALGCHEARTRIRIGMPDDYLGTIGAALIENFSQRNPQLQVEIVSDFSFRLQKLLEEGHLDLVVFTRQSGQAQGEFLRREPQLWCTAPNCYPERQNVLPLVLFPDGCRARPQVLSALDGAGLRWRIVCTSSHLAGVQTAVRIGAALTVLPASVISPEWRILGQNENLPALKPLELALLVPADAHVGTRRLAQFIRELVALPRGDVAPSVTQAAAL